MLRIKMSYIDKIFPFYGKLQNDDEVYIACEYSPYNDESNESPNNYGYKSVDKNRRLAFLSYLPLSIPRSSDNFNTPNIYPTINARNQSGSFDLLFTPVSQAASVFNIKNICNNQFELLYNNFPVYISDALIQFNIFNGTIQELTGGKMFTITKSSNDSENKNTYISNYNQFSTYYGVFQLLFNLTPVYKVGCLNSKCGCNDTENNCCIPQDISSLSITNVCSVQTNGITNNYKILIIPKNSRYISINGEIYNDNTTIYNFLFTWDSIVNNELQAPYTYYSKSLFKSLEISKKTFTIKYCKNNEICGDNGGCYGSCSDNCLSTDTKCYNISGRSECLTDSEIRDLEEDLGNNSENINFFTIITIIFAVLLAIAFVVFLIVIFTKSKKQLNIKPTYNVTVYEKDETN